MKIADGIPMGIRLPKDVRDAVVKVAAEERRSINAQVAVLVERGLKTLKNEKAETASAIPAE